MNRSMLIAALAFCAVSAHAQNSYDAPNKGQDVAVDSITIVSVQVGTTMTRVDTPQLVGSWKVTVTNMDTVNAACCSLDSTANNTAGSGRSCQQLNKYAAGDKPGATFVFKRWYQNLKLYCMTLAGSGTSEIRAIQER